MNDRSSGGKTFQIFSFAFECIESHPSIFLTESSEGPTLTEHDDGSLHHIAHVTRVSVHKAPRAFSPTAASQDSVSNPDVYVACLIGVPVQPSCHSLHTH
jgi:hypothetical protein